MTEIKEKDLQNVTGGGIMRPGDYFNKNKYKTTDYEGYCENFRFATAQQSSDATKKCGSCEYCLGGGDGIYYCKKMKGESL